MNRRIAPALAVSALAGMAGAYLVNDKTLQLFPETAPLVASGSASTSKVKLLRVPDGTLFAIYGEALDAGLPAYDVRLRTTRPPSDIVLSTSTDNGATWSAPINLSNAAALSSARGMLKASGEPPLDAAGHPDLAADPRATDYPGDADKPNVFNVGNQIIVTWASKYCPGGSQRFLVYPELNGITIPYSCLYVSRLRWDSASQQLLTTWPGGLPYRTDQLSSGERDVKQDVNRGNAHAFVINWQEDPLGLKLGEAEGPGDGASGANVSAGTDIWYASLPTGQFNGGDWLVPVRITRNTSETVALSSSGEKATHPPGLYDRGLVGASRSNLGQIGTSVVIAYEETKGAQGAAIGKYVRYHSFPWDAPPPGGETGCIISEPGENARRVRFLTQEASNEVPLVLFYRQGEFNQGGPADVFLRRATGGQITPDALDPPVDAANCTSSVVTGGNPLLEITQAPAINMSGSAALGQATGSAPDALSGDNPMENTIAHRGLIRGSTLFIGYSYTPDLFRFQYLDDTDPYNFYVRRSTDGGLTWGEAVNMTPEITGPSRLSVKEPRLVGTPPSVAGGLPGNTQDPNVVYVAYGLQTHVRQPLFQPVDVDIYMMVSLDEGATWSQA